MTTVRKLSKSVPRHLSMVLRSTCRNAHVVGLPHYAFVAFVVRLRSLSPSAPLGATPTATAHTRSSAPTASCSALLWWTASEMCSSRRRTSAAPIPASCPATALQSPHGTPPHRPKRKKGGGDASLRGVNSYASNPATTVSSVEESNAFAASVTGRYAKRTD